MSSNHKSSIFIYFIIFVIFFLIATNEARSQNVTTTQTTIRNSWYNLLPNFIKNFIHNITNFTEEKLNPSIQNEVGEVVKNPTNQSVQQIFFDKIKSRLSNLSEEINNFFKIDVGSAFKKIMNLFIYGFNKGVEFIKNLFSLNTRQSFNSYNS